MHTVLRVAGLILVTHLGISRTAAAQATSDPVRRSGIWDPASAPKPPLAVAINWNTKPKTGKVPERVTPKTVVRLHVESFNFFRFEPEFSVDTKTIPGYSYLEGLWAQVLSLAPAAPTPVGNPDDVARLAKQSEFLFALESWRNAIASSNEQMKVDLKQAVPTTVVLSQKDTIAIRASVTVIERFPENLEQKRRATEALVLRQFGIAARQADSVFRAATGALNAAISDSTKLATAIVVANRSLQSATTNAQRQDATKTKTENEAALTAATEKIAAARAELAQFSETATITTSPIAEAYYAQELYDAQLVHHNETLAKLKVFIDRAHESLRGRTKDLPSQKAGTIVTVTVRAKPLNDTGDETKQAAEAGPITVSYYVQSDRPLMFHAGAAYTRIDMVEFEKIQKDLTRDVFQEVDAPDASADLIAYMTYMLTPEVDNWAGGFGLTIGTGLRDLGKRLYLGATFRLTNRLILTGGGFSQTVTEADGRALSEANPKLFDAIKRVKQWGWFAGVSATPF